jgi:hypothetical protein
VNLDLEPILAARGIVTGRLLDYDWAELSDPFRRDELRELLFSDRDPANRDLAPAAVRHFLDLRARLDAGGTRLVQAMVAASILAALLACVPGGLRRPTLAAPTVHVLTASVAAVPVPAASVPAASALAMSVPVETPSGGAPSATVLAAVATSGFAAMALELAVLLLFQVIFGNLYLRLSLLVTLFLGGAAIGAFVAPRLIWAARAQIRLADVAVALMALALLAVGKLGTGDLGPGAWGPSGLSPGTQDTVRWIAGYLLLPLLALLAAVPMGVQFAAAGRIAPGATSALGRLYLADLAGAASGTLVTGLWLLPRGGIHAVIATVVAIKVTSLGLQILKASGHPAAPV